MSKKGKGKLTTLLEEGSSDEDDVLSTPTTISHDTSKPWLQEFQRYLNGADELPSGMSLIQWWGINSTRLLVWASLARDYLAIMSSSVSSERAFSAAGITISKRRNRLKGDIVEALQFLKHSIRTDLLFREPAPCSILELDYSEDAVDDDGNSEWVDEVEHEVLSINVDSDSEGDVD